MNRYKEEVDALHASDALKERIAALNTGARPRRMNTRRIAAIAAVLVVVLLAGVVTTPLLFSVQKPAMAEERSYDSAAENAFSPAEGNYDTGGSVISDIMESAAEDAPADGKSYAADSGRYAIPKSAAPTQSTSASPNAGASGTNKTPALPSGRKLIRNADLCVQTKSFDEFHNAVLQKTAALQGYVESSESGAFSKLRYEYLTLRIPADSLDDFLTSVAELGTVTSQNTSVQDVTDRYIDVKSRLAALETEQETLLSLLKKAENLMDILEIQDRLAEVRGSLESYKAQLQALDSQIDYSTVQITVNEVERVSPPETKGFFAEVRQNLSENLYSIGQGARSFAVWFLSSLPYILIFLAAVAVIVVAAVLIRRRRRRRK